MNNENNNQKINLKKKKWLSIILAFIIFLIGIYFYLFYMKPDHGIAVINPELHNIDIVLLGNDNNNGKTNMESVVLVQLRAQEKSLVFQVISPDIKSGNKTLREINIDNKSEIGNIIESNPEYYFMISYQGFKKIIDELNGIEIFLEAPVEVPEFGLYLKQGNNLLSGKEALNYARWCNNDSDNLNRVQRQEKIIKGIVDKVFQTNTLLNIPRLYSTIVETYKGVDTNLDKELVIQIIKLLRNSDMWDIEYKINI